MSKEAYRTWLRLCFVTGAMFAAAVIYSIAGCSSPSQKPADEPAPPVYPTPLPAPILPAPIPPG